MSAIGDAFKLALIIVASLAACSAEVITPHTTLQSIDGRRIAIDSIPEPVTIVYFWATSCTICRAEQAALSRLYQRYHTRGLEVIGVAMAYDRPDEVLRYVKASQIPYPIALDLRGIAAQAFGGILGTPTSFILLKKKGIHRKIVGAIDFNVLGAELTQLLSSSS